MINKIEADKQTPLGNTGSISQDGFAVGIDWLDLMIRDIQRGDGAVDFLSMLSTVVDDELTLPDERGRFCGEKWRHSCTSPGGIVIDYNPPVSEPYYSADAYPDWPLRLQSLNRLLPSSDAPFSYGYIDSLSGQAIDGFYLKAPTKTACLLDSHSRLLSNNDPLHYGYKWERTTEWRTIKPGKMRISMSGKSCSRIYMLPLLEFLAMSRDTYRIECTRIDLYLDDMNRILKREDILAAIDAGNYSGARTALPYEPRVMGVVTGWTHYFGSVQSDKRVRIYDKGHESGGLNPAIRMEVQNRREIADETFRTILAIAEHGNDHIPTFIASLVVGSVSFIDRSSGDKNIGRCDLLPWYERLIEATTTPIRLKTKREQPTVQKKIMHIAKQTMKSLAILSAIIGTGAVHSLVDDMTCEGKASFTPADEFLIKTTDRDSLCVTRDERKAYQRGVDLARKQLLPLPPVSALIT